MNNIIFETDRFILEAIQEKHFRDLYKLLSNENVHKYFPKALNENESHEFYDNVQKRYIEDGFCFWAVIRKTDLTFVGICGLIKQIINNQIETEVGYRILDTYWGKGYGTEAANGCIKYAKEKLGKQSIISIIREINNPSLKVAEKNGLIFEAEIVFNNLPHKVYRKLLL